MKKLILTLVFMISPSALAESIPQVKNFVATEISKISEARQLTLLNQPESSAEYELDKFSLRLRAEIAFSIEIGKISLVPELELGWEKRK